MLEILTLNLDLDRNLM